MSKKLSCLQAYKIMYDFINMIYFETYDESLSDILSAGFLYSENLNESPQTMDAAIWDDWMNAVKIIFNDDLITYDSVKLTNKQAYRVMSQYLITYCNIGASDSIKTLRYLINKNKKEFNCIKWLHCRWDKSIQKILHPVSLSKDGTNFFVKQTELTNREAFITLQNFLDMLCQKNYNADLIQLVKNSRLKDRSDYWAAIPNIIEPNILQIWQQSINNSLLLNHDKKLNLLIAYQAINKFLIIFFNNNRSDSINDMIPKFEIKDISKPQFSFYWVSWLSASVKVNAEQIEKINNLVSIKMPVQQSIAWKIVKTWLQEYENHLNLYFIEKINSDELNLILVWQNIINNIKKNQRSYLLLENEITILETYKSMIQLLEFYDENLSELKIDHNNKPINFYIMLEWIRISEQVLHEKQSEKNKSLSEN